MARSKGMRNRAVKPPRVRIPLKTAGDVARYMARCVKEGHKSTGGEGPKWYRQAMMCSLLVKALESASLEDRVKALEVMFPSPGRKG